LLPVTPSQVDLANPGAIFVFIWDTLFWMFFCGMLGVIAGGYLDSLPRSRHKSDIVFWLWAATILTFLILSAQPQHARE
jgi:hypothetical protein